MFKVVDDNIYANNITADKNNFVFIKKCKNNKQAMRVAKTMAKIFNEEVIEEGRQM